MEKLLVTGAGGFIGYHLSNYLSDRGYDVTGVDLHFPDAFGLPRFRAVKGDFRDTGLMSNMLQNVKVIFHLASAHLEITLSESDYWDINVHSLDTFLETACKGGVERFVHVSSVGAFGNLKSWPANEETDCNPQSIYGETKVAGELVVKKFSEKNGFPSVILRPAWVYGPGCPRTLKLYRALKKRRFIMIGKGGNMRHPVYISDMLDSLYLAMKKDDAVGKLLVIGGDHAITTRELIDTFCSVMDIPRPRIKIPYSLGVVLATSVETLFGLMKKEPPLSRRTLEFFNTNNSFDISKARNVLGYNPEFTFEDGLSDCKSWLLKNH